MIFAVPTHIEQIIDGTKVQTRRQIKPGHTFIYDYEGDISEVRLNGRLQYQVGRVYSAVPGRGKPGLCKFKVTAIRIVPGGSISTNDALAEGGYTPRQYTTLLYDLYDQLDDKMIAYTFEYVPGSASGVTPSHE
jgi:hypothetical protein